MTVVGYESPRAGGVWCALGSAESGRLTRRVQSSRKDVMPRGYPAEFRRKVPDLLRAGRSVPQIARNLQISDQTSFQPLGSPTHPQTSFLTRPTSFQDEMVNGMS